MAVETLGVDLSSSAGIAVNGDALADWADDTAVTWVELEASTPVTFGGFLVKVGTASTKNERGVIKIATGAAGSEVEIVRLPSRLLERAGPVSVFVPVAIPSGSRVSVAAANSGGFSRVIQVIGYPESEIGAAPFSVMDVGPFRSGAQADYARGVEVIAAATAHTKGAWTEVSQDTAVNRISGDALPHDYDHLGLMFLSASNPIASAVLVDLAVGPAGSEVIIAENLGFNEFAGSGSAPSWPSILWISASVIPSGSRISARIQCSEASRAIELLLAGVR